MLQIPHLLAMAAFQTAFSSIAELIMEGASDLFESQQRQGDRDEDAQAQIDELYRQIGQLKVERDFLADRSARFGLPTEKPW